MSAGPDRRPLVPTPVARGTHGAVVAPHYLATAAGLAILRQGGSAVDAAIATNAVLAVVRPQACGIGGDAFWLVWDAAAGRQLALNGSGRSAAAIATPCSPSVATRTVKPTRAKRFLTTYMLSSLSST